MVRKKALITGITGQDGAYLSRFLLSKGYEVHGIKRRSSLFNTQRIDPIYEDPHVDHRSLILHYGDLTDTMSLFQVMEKVRPDEIYNLGAMSHVAVSFENPIYSADVNALGTLRLLEAMRVLGLGETTRFYQASTSELYGKVREIPQRESTPFHPRSPYGVSKLFAFWSVVNYREAYDMFAVNGVLFNHESPLRGETFVSRKITRALARIKLGLQDRLYLGNLDAKRDWGHAKDYVEMQWMMLQQAEPRDFVIATGQQITVREFVERAARLLDMNIEWSGKELEEIGVDNKTGKTIVEVDPRYFRPAEVETLLGDASLAKDILGWTPKSTIDHLIKEMIESDFRVAQQESLLQEHGHRAPKSNYLL